MLGRGSQPCKGHLGRAGCTAPCAYVVAQRGIAQIALTLSVSPKLYTTTVPSCTLAVKRLQPLEMNMMS